MTAGEYNQQVIEHFEHPRHLGCFDTAPDIIAAHAGSRTQGAEFSFSARIRDARVIALRFQAYGCPHSIAAASWLTGRLVGATQQDLSQWHWREVAQLLEVPVSKRGRLLILQDAVHALAENWQRKSL